MPQIKEIFQAAANRRHYAKLDLRDAHHQMLVHAGDRHETGWLICDHHVIIRRLDFGHADGPKWFKLASETAFSGGVLT